MGTTMKITVFSQYTAVTLAFSIIFLLPMECGATFFKYKDDRGILVISNRLENIPKRYRNRVKVVWEADMEAKDPVARKRAAAMKHIERQEAEKKSRQEAEEKKASSKKGKTLVIELDEKTGQLIRRFE
jgi:hypothetical protein